MVIFFSSKFMDHSQKNRKRHDLAFENFERVKDEWNEDRMKRLDFLNKRLHEKNEGKAYMNNVDEGKFEYHQVFAK